MHTAEAATLTDDDVAAWGRDGFLVVPGAFSAEACAALVERAAEHVAAAGQAPVSVFSTQEQQRTSDEWFLGSGGAIRCFFEEEAFTDEGALAVPLEQAINKVGHAQHDLDPVYDAFARDPVMARTAAALGVADARLVQSMHIFKQPRIGGEVTCHQDATFLSTEPPSVVGLWVALEDATLDNGCLWAQPGGHRGPLRRRFVRAGTSDGDGTRFVDLDPTPLPAPGPDGGLVPLEVAAGTLIALHGLLPHWSGPNRSDRSRQAYTLHVVDGSAEWPADAWLQRPADLPFRGF
ncbi:phytanoyl-CoA dioxygenase family protein [Iamia majanohamensis]|uniref:Phytanoyl-CoA dioxygenase family protein n=1 Tax=Iamia majanohamensis TaxID=467976 RepID=A0AAE9YHQ3_9ACTN|nr:phytanoyl-CoA dioxygenase family protein [Iamia majanohamensis]WCO68702.1 phytanoyl-CoA dioxygenase family protein [Iamia majanohamensis]